MSDQELRELDAWCLEHVLKFKRATNFTELQSVKCNCFYIPNRGPVIAKFKDQNGAQKYWSGTTDPAAAMAVLEKCAEKVSVTISKDKDGQFSVEWWVDEIPGVAPIQGSRWHQIQTAPTLPLAICQFAKKLFGGAQ